MIPRVGIAHEAFDGEWGVASGGGGEEGGVAVFELRGVSTWVEHRWGSTWKGAAFAGGNDGRKKPHQGRRAGEGSGKVRGLQAGIGERERGSVVGVTED